MFVQLQAVAHQDLWLVVLNGKPLLLAANWRIEMAWHEERRWKSRLVAEVAVMRGHFPAFQLMKKTDRGLLWVGVLAPTPEDDFFVGVEYPDDYPHRAPALWVLEPELVPGALHVYSDGSCCIHSDSWNPDRGTAASCVPLIAGWLVAIQPVSNGSIVLMPYECLIAQRAYAMIVGDCRSDPEVETGGALLGVVDSSSVQVLFSVSAGPKAHRSRTGFRPNSTWQQRYLDYLFARFGTNYIGDWHKHPAHVPTPSTTDLAAARTVVTSSARNTPQAVFPIATLDRGVVSLRAFRISRTSQQFDEVPITIVPDSDPRLIAVLTGNTTGKEEGHDAHHHGAGRRPGSTLLKRLARRFRYSPAR